MHQIQSVAPLDLSGNELRGLLDAVSEYLVAVVDRLPTEPIADFEDVSSMLRSTGVRRPPPEHGRPLGELLDTVDRAAAKGINVASGGLFAYVPSSGLVASAAADLIAGVLSRFTGQAVPAPGLVAMESSVLRWIAELFELPPEAMGIFTTGGSTATLSALITARVAKLRGSFAGGVIYVTEQTHGCVVKAALLAGFRRDNIRVVPVDEHLRMDVTALRSSISADRRRGMQPFFIAASAGTTNAGTIDPLLDLADLAIAQDLWLHVDAAYGGFFQLTGRGRERLRGIEHADSIVLDPHKSLFMAMGTGCLLVRDSELLRQAHAADAAPYLQDLGGSDLPNFADYSIDLTRDFRGLRVWLPLHLHGVSAFRAALEAKLDLAEQVYDTLVVQPQLAVMSPPVLSTVVFRMAGDDEAVDERTAELLACVNAERRVHLSSTRIGGRTMIRMCILHHRVDAARVEEAVAAILRHSSALSVPEWRA